MVHCSSVESFVERSACQCLDVYFSQEENVLFKKNFTVIFFAEI